MSDPIPPPPFVVTEALSKVYYKGLPSEPPLIATTKPRPFEYPTGPEAYSVLKELRELGDHPLATVWDHGLAKRLCRGLNEMCVNCTSIDAVRVVQVGESSGPAIVWISVKFGALSFEEGSIVAQNCHMSINGHYHVIFPFDKDDNKPYERKNDSKAREDVVVLSTSNFNEKLAAIDYDIRAKRSRSLMPRRGSQVGHGAP